MSQYYNMRVGFVHEERLDEWVALCEKLHSVGLLDEHAVPMEFEGEMEGRGRSIFDMVRLGQDPRGLLSESELERYEEKKKEAETKGV